MTTVEIQDLVSRKVRAKTIDNVLNGGEAHLVLGSINGVRERLCTTGIMSTGFRRGELVHCDRNWLSGNSIIVPSRIECDCWECKKERWSRLTKRSKERRLIKPSGYWMPKTDCGARAIPLNPISRELFEGFFSEHFAVREVVPCTRSVYYTVKLVEARILKGLEETFFSEVKLKRQLELKEKFDLDVELSNYVKSRFGVELIPHGLRGTYASRLAQNGINMYDLKDIMGWDDIKIAAKYVRLFGPPPKSSKITISDLVSTNEER